jgi:hypothetical protein
LIAETCENLAQPDLAFAPAIPTRIAFWVTVINSTKLVAEHYSTATARAIRISFMQRFSAVDAESRPQLTSAPTRSPAEHWHRHFSRSRRDGRRIIAECRYNAVVIRVTAIGRFPALIKKESTTAASQPEPT